MQSFWASKYMMHVEVKDGKTTYSIDFDFTVRRDDMPYLRPTPGAQFEVDYGLLADRIIALTPAKLSKKERNAVIEDLKTQVPPKINIL